ncbi:ArsR/SmtB family transcription factor [Haloferula sp.]|uniref:ArsR/SmtB family transcription factor n=1 Tax=Haloferula sp. TaxID=2497595 RepID=UPI003C751CD6
MTKEELQAIKDEFEQNQSVCQHVVELCHLLSNKARFRIVCTLMHGEACVQDIADVVGDSQLSNISQQLRVLRLAGIVEKRRDKKQIHYRVSDPRVGALIEFLRANYLEPTQTS